MTIFCEIPLQQTLTSIIDGGNKVTDVQDIANSFNNTLINIVKMFIPDTILDTLSEHTLLKDFVKNKMKPIDKFSILLITEEKGRKIICPF